MTKIIQEKTIQMVRNKIITDVDEGKVYEKGNQMTGQANFLGKYKCLIIELLSVRR